MPSHLEQRLDPSLRSFTVLETLVITGYPLVKKTCEEVEVEGVDDDDEEGWSSDSETESDYESRDPRRRSNKEARPAVSKVLRGSCRTLSGI